MFDNDSVSIDCNTCVATGTTACNDCLVGHVLANQSGPINLVVVPRSPQRVAEHDVSRVVTLMARAGLIDNPPRWVTAHEFASSGGVAARLVR